MTTEELVRSLEAKGRFDLPGIKRVFTTPRGNVIRTPKDERNDVYLTVEEMATWLRVCPATIHRAAKKGQIPGHKVGRAWRFHKGDVLDYLKGPGR